MPLYGFRILVAFEEQYRSYREAISRAIQALRPHAEVTVSDTEGIAEKMALIDPHLVITGKDNTIENNNSPAWLKLPTDPDQQSWLCLAGRYMETDNPGLGGLLQAVDEAEKLVRSDPHARGC